MKNGFRTLYGVKDIGLAPSAIGAAVSVFMIAGLLCRAPAGAITDNNRKKLKYVLAVAMVLKGLTWIIGFGAVTNTTGLYILFFLDGVFWSFAGTALPAVLALSVDRRAMGTGYAVMMGLTQVICGSSRSVGISLYNNGGVRNAAMVAAVLSFVAAGLALLMDSKALVGNEAANRGPKKKSSGLNASVLPIAIVGAMPIVLFNTESNFLQLYAEERQFEYLSATTLGGTLAGVMSIVSGFLCDIMSPSILIYIALAGQVIGCLLWGVAGNATMFQLGIIIYYVTRFYSTPIRIVGMKAVSRDEQGSLSSTMLMCNDALSLLCNLIVGWGVTKVGYNATFLAESVWCALSILVFVYVDRSYLKKLQASQNEAAEVMVNN